MPHHTPLHSHSLGEFATRFLKVRLAGGLGQTRGGPLACSRCHVRGLSCYAACTFVSGYTCVCVWLCVHDCMGVFGSEHVWCLLMCVVCALLCSCVCTHCSLKSPVHLNSHARVYVCTSLSLYVRTRGPVGPCPALGTSTGAVGLEQLAVTGPPTTHRKRSSAQRNP